MFVSLQQLPKIVLAVCCALTAHQAALLTWAVYPVEESKYTWTPPAPKASGKKAKLDTSNIQQAELFGDYQGDAIAPVAANAPKTRLKITLVGIVAASDPDYSSVIIEHKGEQDSYFMNSTITGTSAKVTKIFSDKIIITVKGEQQTLILEGLDKDSAPSTAKSSKSKRSKKGSKSKKIDLDRSALLSDPGKLTDYIKISPVREGSEIKGYRIKPGKDSSLFEEAGLESGDLAVELNGIDLTDTTQAMGLMKEFPTMTDISLTVDREGERHELFFRIP